MYNTISDILFDLLLVILESNIARGLSSDGLCPQNLKTIKVALQYLENIGKERNYHTGVLNIGCLTIEGQIYIAFVVSFRYCYSCGQWKC